MQRYLVCLISLYIAGCGAKASHMPNNGVLYFEDLGGESADLGQVGSGGDFAVADLARTPVRNADLAIINNTACGVKVNEILLSVMSGSTEQTTNEYVEIYNSCSTSIDIKGWSLDYRSVGNNSSGSNADIVLVADLNKTIAGGAYLLWAGAEYTGGKDGALSNSLADAGGGVALVDGSGTIVDSVTYGPVVASHNFTEGSAAPLPAPTKSPGQSLARIPNGADSNQNDVDFQVTDPTPRAQNM